MPSLSLKLLTGGVIALVGSIAQAVDPANYLAGPILLTPTLDIRAGFVDNLLRTDDEEEDTGFSVLEPRLQAWVENGLNTYSLTYKLSDFRYFDSSDDDFTDHTFNLDVHHEFNASNVVELFGEYYAGHEERGTGVSEGLTFIIDEPVELDRTILGGNYNYGTRTAKGRLRLGARAIEHEYQNFDDYTRYRSRDRYDYDGTFFWKLASKTDVLAQVRLIDTEYDKTRPLDPGGTMDSEEINYFVGVAWEATARTSGSIKVGLFDREYDSGERSDDDGFSWEIDLNYLLRSYSRFNLESKRYFEETNGLGDGVDTSRTTLSWNHDWSSRASTRMSFQFGTEDYTDSEREDDRYSIEAAYTYALYRWIDLGLGYRYQDRDSDLSRYDFSRNEAYLEAKFSL